MIKTRYFLCSFKSSF